METVNLGVVGCGDVAFRTYFSAMRAIAETGAARVVACFDPVSERAERAAAFFGTARAYSNYSELLAHDELNAVFNLTPAPFHREVTAQALGAGMHCFSEKPLAASVADAQELIEQARQARLLLMCAPAVMATPRFRWLKQMLETGRIGRPTVATAQMANMGPASWRTYTGDPAVFYGPQVGPMLDTGVYVLHGLTGLLGPAQRVEAFGGIAIPRREVLIERLAGQTIDVGTNDVMMIHLHFARGAFAQVLSSFAVPSSQAPAMELHGSGGSISINQRAWYNAEGPIDLYQIDKSPAAAEGWLHDVWPPTPNALGNGRGSSHLLDWGVEHFVACIRRQEMPILTAEHACHVLDIMLKATASAGAGRALELETTF